MAASRQDRETYARRSTSLRPISLLPTAPRPTQYCGRASRCFVRAYGMGCSWTKNLERIEECVVMRVSTGVVIEHGHAVDGASCRAAQSAGNRVGGIVGVIDDQQRVVVGGS